MNLAAPPGKSATPDSSRGLLIRECERNLSFGYGVSCPHQTTSVRREGLCLERKLDVNHACASRFFLPGTESSTPEPDKGIGSSWFSPAKRLKSGTLISSDRAHA